MAIVRDIVRPVVRDIVYPVDSKYFSWSRYWKSLLDTWYKNRTELVLNENQVPFVGEILPSVAKLNGTDDTITVADSDIFSFTTGAADKPYTIEVLFKTPSTLVTNEVHPIISKDNGSTLREWNMIITNIGHVGTYSPRLLQFGAAGQLIDADLNCVADTWYRMFFTYSGVGGNNAYQGMNIYNGATKLTVLAHAAGAYTNMANTAQPVTFGHYTTNYRDNQFSYCKIYNVELSQAQITAIVAGGEVADIFHIPFIGQLDFEYDITGGRNGTRSGTGDPKAYDANGSTYLLDNGWSLWDKAGISERVASGGITTDIEALGYSQVATMAASLGFINMADCLVGFNPTSDADSKLAIFDRSNTTRQTAASRASIYYDSTSLATKSRYQIDELATYVTLQSFFNAAYKDRLASKIVTSGGYTTRLDEVLNSPTPM